MNEIFIKIRNNGFLRYIILAFIAGCICTGLLVYGQGSAIAGRLDKRYDNQHRGAGEIIARLEGELERERDINRQLREHNSRARELTEGLTFATERNVRNLQDAVSLIGEIRTKIKVLEEFYANSDSYSSAN